MTVAGWASQVAGARGSDRRWMLLLTGAVVLVIVLVSIVAPVSGSDDDRPSSYNAAPNGTKAAFLMLESLGRPVARWEEPLDALDGVDAAHTTLVLASPAYTALEKDRLAAAVQRFLHRGGRLLTTGAGGALLIPGGAARGSERLGKLCFTTPEGPGALATAGEVELNDDVRWAGDDARAFVEHRCGTDAVVVRVREGNGEAIWWSSPSPMTNAELRHDADLRLFLESLGGGRRVLFDESLQQRVRSSWSATRGLPLWWILGQAGVVFGLLVFSFSRRRGPIRLPVAVPRSSPVEFAVSMGDLYEKAGATGAATEAARRRLLRTLAREARLSEATLAGGPEAIAEALRKRFGGEWSSLAEHLREAAAAADVNARLGSALQLVRALGEDEARVRQAANAPARTETPQLVAQQR